MKRWVQKHCQKQITIPGTDDGVAPGDLTLLLAALFYASTSTVDDSDGVFVAPSRLRASITPRGAVIPPWYAPCLVLSIPSYKATFDARGTGLGVEVVTLHVGRISTGGARGIW